MLPEVSFAVNGRGVHVAGWQFNDTEGGNDQCSGFISETDYRAIDSPTQGAIVHAYADDSSALWGGRLAAPPQLIDGKAIFNAVGFKEEAAKKVERLFIQSADMSQWVEAESDPHLTAGVPVYSNISRYDPSGKGSLVWRVNGGQVLSTGHANAFVFYAEGVNLQVVRYTSNFTAGDAFAKLSFRASRANGPVGAETSFGSHTLAVGNQNVAQEFIHAQTGNDIILLQIECTDGTFAPNASKMKWSATNVRVNSDVTNATNFDAWEVVDYIGDQLQWDTSGIAPDTFQVLPFDWTDGSWLDAALYLADLEDKFMRVGPRTNTGPLVEYDDWGTNQWTVFTSDGADPDLKPLEVYNRAWVWFETAAGVRRKMSRDCADAGVADPLEPSSIVNVYEHELEDRQITTTLASGVGDRLVRRFSQQRYAGTIEVVKAVNTGTRDENPRRIRYGDTIRVSDWGPGEGQTLRVEEVSQTASGVQLGVEQPVNLNDLMTGGRKGKRKKKKRRGGGGSR